MRRARRRRKLGRMEPQTISHVVEDLTIYATVQGEGPPLVLVHGLGLSSESWALNVEELARCARVYAVDLPGCGASDKPAEALAPHRLAEVLCQWCDAEGIATAAFAGHSLGGEVCLWLAVKRPDLVDRLVLAASTGACPRGDLVGRLGSLLADAVHEPVAFAPRLLKSYLQARPWRILQTARGTRSPELLRLLGTIQAPALVICGRHDAVVPLQESKRLARALPNARLAIVEDGAHGLIFDAPESFNGLVCGFLGDRSPAATPGCEVRSSWYTAQRAKSGMTAPRQR